MAEAGAEPAAGPRGWFAGLKAPEPTAFLAPSLIAWRRSMTVLIIIGLAHTYLHPTRGLPDVFFYAQDLPIAGLMFLLHNALYVTPARWPALPRLQASWRTMWVVAAAVTLGAWAGVWVVLHNYPLSTDEFLATFDARILASGHLSARLPEVWRLYSFALEPRFVIHTWDGRYWYSSYLPVNAAFLALASAVKAGALLAPLWAGLAVLATFGVARRLWPTEPNAAPVAALLLASSAQLLFTAMTPYAMSAHLALNMAWLWLVLRGGKLGHGAAAGVAFLATGLHQIIFHPLFAAPFVLEMWLARRWKPATWHTCAYAAIGLFWMAYPPMHLASFGIAPAEARSHVGVLANIRGLLGDFDPLGWGYMVKNLVRFFTWQSLLAVPLALVAIVPAVRAGGPLRAMVVGLALTTLAMFVLLPYQGHGWGYRYLHGLLGSLCLLGAAGWMRLTRDSTPKARQAQNAVFAAAIAASVLILIPVRAWQARAFEAPYLAAERKIRATPADVMIVDDDEVAFGADLIRNDPFLRNRPLIMQAAALSPAQVTSLCATRTVAWFRQADAYALGIKETGPPPYRAMLTACPPASAARDPHLIPYNIVGDHSKNNGRPATQDPTSASAFGSAPR